MSANLPLWFGLLALQLVLVLSGCASNKPIIQTQVIDKPVPVYCNVEIPKECKDTYAVDQVSTRDDPVTINRAFRQEIEERWTCEIKLRAALIGCNSTRLKVYE